MLALTTFPPPPPSFSSFLSKRRIPDPFQCICVCGLPRRRRAIVLVHKRTLDSTRFHFVLFTIYYIQFFFFFFCPNDRTLPPRILIRNRN